MALMYANHIGAQGGGFEPQRQNNALLYIVGLDAATAGNASSGDRDDVLTLSLSSFPLPKVNNNIIEVGYLNETRKFAGKATYEDLSVVYKDTVDRGTAAALWKWRYQVSNPETGRIGLARDYKKSGFIKLFAPDGSEQFEREYELVGIWPQAMDPGDIDMMSDDSVNISVTLVIDKFIPRARLNPGNVSGSGSSNSIVP